MSDVFQHQPNVKMTIACENKNGELVIGNTSAHLTITVIRKGQENQPTTIWLTVDNARILANEILNRFGNAPEPRGPTWTGKLTP